MGRSFDAYRSAQFLLEIDNIIVGEFQEVSGISSENEMIAFQEGGENTYDHKFRGPNKYPNLVLRHGVTSLSPAIWAWREALIHRITPPIHTVAVILLDDLGEEVVRWVCRNASPVKLELPNLKAGPSELAVETLELMYDSYEVMTS